MIPVVFATDHNFVIATGVALLSLIETAGESSYDIYIIIDDDITENDIALLRKQVDETNKEKKHSVNFLKIGDSFKDGYEIRGVSKACYNRLMIPWLLPEYDKVIYSDSDVIFKGSLTEVFETNLGNNLVAGVGGKIWSKLVLRRYLEKLGLDPKKYINSGFLLINCKQQKKLDLKDTYLKLAKSKYVYQDQDIINIVCKGRIFQLPQEYNVKPTQVSEYEDKKFYEKIKVLHYIGPKPWAGFTLCWTDWWEVYNRSVFFNPEFYMTVSRNIRSVSGRMKSYLADKMTKIKLAGKLLF